MPTRTRKRTGDTMTIAIIGTGAIGSALAADLAAGGTDLLIAGHTPEKSQALAATLDGHGTAVTVQEAVAQADVLIFAVWYDTIRELIAEYGDALSGKIIVDPSNPIAPDPNGGFVKTIPAEDSAGQLLAALLPAGATLVKAFGSLAAGTLASASRQTPEEAVLFYAADDQAAGDTVAGLIRAAGFEPVPVGGVDQSIRIEVFGDLHEFGAIGGAVTKDAALTAVAGAA
ncbi:MAG: NAD(P)-binding domain-containing protein [Propionicimonas sp.]|nr:NAD(P)-binding domain-containing protein [Propionicimonas sp.]